VSSYHFIHYTSTIFPHPLYKISVLVPKSIHKTGTSYFTYNPLSGYNVSNKRQMYKDSIGMEYEVDRKSL